MPRKVAAQALSHGRRQALAAAQPHYIKTCSWELAPAIPAWGEEGFRPHCLPALPVIQGPRTSTQTADPSPKPYQATSMVWALCHLPGLGQAPEQQPQSKAPR